MSLIYIGKFIFNTQDKVVSVSEGAKFKSHSEFYTEMRKAFEEYDENTGSYDGWINR